MLTAAAVYFLVGMIVLPVIDWADSTRSEMCAWEWLLLVCVWPVILAVYLGLNARDLVRLVRSVVRRQKQ